MPLRPRPSHAPLLAALLAGGVVAATPALAAAAALKPGLWSYSLLTRRGDGPPMNLAQMLRSLPAAARPRVEARLRAQGMGIGPDGGLRICLDAGSLSAGHPPLHLPGRCTEHWKLSAPGDWNFHYACTQPTVDGRGSLRISAPTSYASDYTVTGPQGSVSGSAHAHWLASACGGVPPLGMAR